MYTYKETRLKITMLSETHPTHLFGRKKNKAPVGFEWQLHFHLNKDGQMDHVRIRPRWLRWALPCGWLRGQVFAPRRGYYCSLLP
jgi:hypothetical protein